MNDYTISIVPSISSQTRVSSLKPVELGKRPVLDKDNAGESKGENSFGELLQKTMKDTKDTQPTQSAPAEKPAEEEKAVEKGVSPSELLKALQQGAMNLDMEALVPMPVLVDAQAMTEIPSEPLQTNTIAGLDATSQPTNLLEAVTVKPQTPMQQLSSLDAMQQSGTVDTRPLTETAAIASAPKADLHSLEAAAPSIVPAEQPASGQAAAEAGKGSSTQDALQIPVSELSHKEKPQSETALDAQTGKQPVQAEQAVAEEAPKQTEAHAKAPEQKPAEIAESEKNKEQKAQPVYTDVAAAPKATTSSEVHNAAPVSEKPVETPEVPVSRQIFEGIREADGNGQKEIHIQLYPKDLGQVSVKLAEKDGLMVIDISSPSSRTQQILLSSAGEIRSILESQLGTKVEVAFSQAEQRNDYLEDRQQSNQQQNGEQRQEKGQPDKQRQEEYSSADFLSAMQEVAAFRMSKLL